MDWDDLPDAVRLRLAELTAAAVSGIPGSDMPATVRPLARFTPAKRARLGASALLAGLRDSPVFRAAVTEWTRAHRPELLDGAGDDAVADVASRAAAAVLLGEQSAEEQVAEVARRTSDAQLRAERDAALARVERLAAENRRLRSELDAATTAVQGAGSTGAEQADRLRTRLREQGMRLRQALDRAERAA
ncbi:MAG: NYN domain-containing protein, partial [Pseudonocardiaceae bacterium]